MIIFKLIFYSTPWLISCANKQKYFKRPIYNIDRNPHDNLGKQGEHISTLCCSKVYTSSNNISYAAIREIISFLQWKKMHPTSQQGGILQHNFYEQLVFSCTLPVCVHEGGRLRVWILLSSYHWNCTMKIFTQIGHLHGVKSPFFVLKLSNMNYLEKKGKKLSSNFWGHFKI